MGYATIHRSIKCQTARVKLVVGRCGVLWPCVKRPMWLSKLYHASAWRSSGKVKHLHPPATEALGQLSKGGIFMSGFSLGDGRYLDWQEFTVPVRSGESPEGKAVEVADQFGGMQRSEGGRQGYSCWAVVLGSGWLAWHPDRPEMGVHCCLPATACARYSAHWGGLAQVVIWMGGHWTRADLALDTHEVSIETVEGAVSARQVVSRFRDASVVSKLWGDGKTVYLGAAASDSRVRFYDKRAERVAAGEDVEVPVWTRCELQLRRGRADAAMRSLMAGESIEGIIRGVVDFRDLEVNENSARCPSLPWWDTWLGGIQVVKLAVERVRSDLDTWRRWLGRQVKVTLGVVMAAEGGSTGWLHELCREGWAAAPKWKRELVCTPAL